MLKIGPRSSWACFRVIFEQEWRALGQVVPVFVDRRVLEPARWCSRSVLSSVEFTSDIHAECESLVSVVGQQSHHYGVYIFCGLSQRALWGPGLLAFDINNRMRKLGKLTSLISVYCIFQCRRRLECHMTHINERISCSVSNNNRPDWSACLLSNQGRSPWSLNVFFAYMRNCRKPTKQSKVMNERRDLDLRVFINASRSELLGPSY